MAKVNQNKRPPLITPQQKRAVELFKTQLATGGTKSVVEILMEAGYSKASANQQSNIMAGIKPHLVSFITEMEDHRTKVLENMKAKVDTADYAALVRGLDILTRNIQLLGGKPTENVEITDTRRAELDALIDD